MAGGGDAWLGATLLFLSLLLGSLTPQAEEEQLLINKEQCLAAVL